jgi:hypothetical protein
VTVETPSRVRTGEADARGGEVAAKIDLAAMQGG